MEAVKPPPPDSAAVSPAWAHALAARTACSIGRCKYAAPERKPDSYLGAVGCDGYHATEHVDAEGRSTVRWYLCPRHRAWWNAERSRRAASAGR